jgi:hypothetical protein
METKKPSILEYERVLPENFDGTFRFTNWTDEDFIATWGKKEYRFPAQTTSPMIFTDQTPLEIQSIRKKFAKDLAEREFFKSARYNKLASIEFNADGTPRLNSSTMANAYVIEDLIPYIQKCLIPLPVGNVFVAPAKEVPIEEKLSRNDEGDLNTVAVDKKVSLRKKALES